MHLGSQCCNPDEEVALRPLARLLFATPDAEGLRLRVVNQTLSRDLFRGFKFNKDFSNWLLYNLNHRPSFR